MTVERLRWVAIFDDHDGRESVRKEHSAAHFDYLTANRDRILIAGGLRPAPGEWYCGGLWGKAPCYESVTL